MNLKEELDACKRALGINPDDIEAYLRLGNVYRCMGFNYEARDAYGKAHKLLLTAPLNDAKKYLSLGSYYWKLKSYNSAIIAYKKSLEIEPNNEKVYLSLGLAYCITWQLEEAHEAFKAILNIKPDFVIARSILGAISILLGNRRNAFREYDAINEINPKLADELLTLTLHKKTVHAAR